MLIINSGGVTVKAECVFFPPDFGSSGKYFFKLFD